MAPASSYSNVIIGDDENMVQNMTRNQAIDSIVAKRSDQWTAAINAELQSLITEAASIRQNISTAKTQTKRNYYQKKFNKVSVQVRQMVAALQRVQSTTSTTNMNPDQANDTSTTSTN